MLERLGERALPERDIRLLSGFSDGLGICCRAAPDAVLEDRERGVDLPRLVHPRDVVDYLVSGRFGTSQINKIKETVFFSRKGRVLNSDTADGMGAGRGVVLERGGGGTKGGGGIDEAEELRPGSNMMFDRTSELSSAEGVFKNRDLLPGVEEIWDKALVGKRIHSGRT